MKMKYIVCLFVSFLLKNFSLVFEVHICCRSKRPNENGH